MLSYCKLNYSCEEFGLLVIFLDGLLMNDESWKQTGIIHPLTEN